MNVPAAVANEYLVPRDHVKPDIKVGNYYLQWYSSSYGIPQKEVARLKKFIADIAPYLTTVLYESASAIQRCVRDKTNAKAARLFEDAFAPRVLVTRRMEEIVYTLQMTDDGMTTIGRKEIIISERRKTGLALAWELGELLFNRQP
jgi:hypothetical protein